MHKAKFVKLTIHQLDTFILKFHLLHLDLFLAVDQERVDRDNGDDAGHSGQSGIAELLVEKPDADNDLKRR